VEIFANKIWSEDVDDGPLLIIATPYGPGGRVANSPKAFVPLIKALKDLLELGYVHENIRAFNTVFGANGMSGCLIDFDLGGIIPWGMCLLWMMDSAKEKVVTKSA
jgi:hypothetical protein